MNRVIENNQVELVGEIKKEAEYSHEVCGEGFYMISLKVPRISGNNDEIPVMVSDRMRNLGELHVGLRLRVYGQFRSYNRHEETGNRLILSVFAQEMEILDDMQSDFEKNTIFLEGYICKEPVYRITPLGREIADVLLAVNRAYGKSDYIPCIAWGRNARYVSSLGIGSHVQASGRIQSREYRKKISEDEVETRIAYEVSVSKFGLVEE